jgi:hypothetical protein
LCFPFIISCNNEKNVINYEQKRALFASEGFGFQYDINELQNISRFLINHGRPINIHEKMKINRYDGIKDKIVTLEYNDCILEFYVWNNAHDGDYPFSMLLSIKSKDDIEYMFGIKNNMETNELFKIIGKMELINNSIWVSSDTGNVATMEIDNNKIKSIIWNYSLE